MENNKKEKIYVVEAQGVAVDGYRPRPCRYEFTDFETAFTIACRLHNAPHNEWATMYEKE